jgi:protein-tyrosine phosphatase
VIDLHCHVLPGIDDGPATIEGSLALARAAAAAGTRTLVATPHVSSRYPNRAAAIAALRDEVAAELEREQLALELRSGAEIAISRIAELEPSELAELGLGGGPYLLLEPPYTPVVTGLDAIVRSVLERGHSVVLAHPERCPGFHRHPAMLAELVNEGALTSLTASSLTGRFGSTVRRFAIRMLDKGLAHNVTSDAHDHERRPPSILPELREAGAQDLEEWLLRDVPSAILAGSAPPRRPAVSIQMRGRKRWPWSRRAA